MSIPMSEKKISIMALIGLTKLWMLLVFLLGGVEVGRSTITEEEDLELERQLQILNKPPIKTFQGQGGDIFDCVDIHKQPAFDNPLLKNHKLQVSPSSLPKEFYKETTQVDEHSSVRQTGIDCPKGTVPIRRTRKEDLIRAKSFDVHSLSSLSPGHHRANARTIPNEIFTYFGAQGYLTTYNPKPVERNQMSMAQMWIENGPTGQLNSLQAGWMVAPQLFGDSLTRLFIAWRVDGNNKTVGCYNLLCLGFVQVDPKNPIGEVLKPLSTYNGSVYSRSFYIFQDNNTRSWWLTSANQDIKYGYWPPSLFTHLGDGASVAAWGGITGGPVNGPSPPMGSGHYPDNQYNHAAYFRNIQVVNGSHFLVIPSLSLLENKMDSPKCYGVLKVGYMDIDHGRVIRFGGKGGNSC